MTTLTTESTLTLHEARAILRNRWRLCVTAALEQLATVVYDAHQPAPHVQAPMNWYEDDDADGSEDEAAWWRQDAWQAEIDRRDYEQGRK